VLVIDDASHDNTAEIVAQLSNDDPRIRYFRQTTNGGPAAARNRGIEESKGELIAFLDADDVWLPNKLHPQVAAMRAYPQLDVLFTDSYDVNPKTMHRKRHSQIHQAIHQSLIWEPLAEQGFYQVSGPVAQALYTRCFIPISTVIVKRTALEAVNGFDLRRFGTEDADLWVRLALRFTFGYWDEPRLIYHQTLNSLSRSGERWGKELVDYHLTSLYNPEYAPLKSLATQKLREAYQQLVSHYGRHWQPHKAIHSFTQSLQQIGFSPKLAAYTALTFLGPLPFALIHRYSRYRLERTLRR
jgi:glycosyltransferase involved in cell wall biosynthesis